MSDATEHGGNCGYWADLDESDCTCAFRLRAERDALAAALESLVAVCNLTLSRIHPVAVRYPEQWKTWEAFRAAVAEAKKLVQP